MCALCAHRERVSAKPLTGGVQGPALGPLAGGPEAKPLAGVQGAEPPEALGFWTFDACQKCILGLYWC